ncbi:hypothetical protein NM688_g8946 [Phlebia brevispora]|uniref:Uncharacterized protein n=1 Tax=Phlebia brevispora TaxID=194682 RepID=A0ACC1RLU8_9APHY|nr:hypothetical protein NM688_g8946 [Phlebia brevispora]
MTAPGCFCGTASVATTSSHRLRRLLKTSPHLAQLLIHALSHTEGEFDNRDKDHAHHLVPLSWRPRHPFSSLEPQVGVLSTISNTTEINVAGRRFHTGYIGGSVLARLLAHPSAKTFDITVIVRSQDKAKKFESFGVKAVVGSFKSDLALLEKLVEESHIVFNCADADDLPSVQTILSGLRKRHAKLGDLPIYIHTSGTGVLTAGYETKGLAASDTIFDDSNVEQIENIPPNALHRNVDLAIVQADKEGTSTFLSSSLRRSPS